MTAFAMDIRFEYHFVPLSIFQHQFIYRDCIFSDPSWIITPVPKEVWQWCDRQCGSRFKKRPLWRRHRRETGPHYNCEEVMFRDVEDATLFRLFWC